MITKTEIQQRIVEKFIMMEFAKGNINSEEQVSEILTMIQKKLNMSAVQAGDFMRNAIGI